MFKKFITILSLAVALMACTVVSASADIIDEIDAADAVEAKLDRMAPTFTYFATCRQVSRKKFTCKFSGFHKSTFVNGRARAVRRPGSYQRFRVTILTYKTS